MAEKQWAGTTWGGGKMHLWLIRLLRLTDVRLIYAFASAFVVPVCLCIRAEGRRAIYHYFRERLGYTPLKAAWKTYINHCMFGQAVVDKFAMYAGKRFNIDIEGYDHFQKLAKQRDSFVQLSSHVGNYEIAGYTLKAEDKPFNALVFSGEKASVMDNRNRMFADKNIRMIAVKSDMSHLFDINRALQDGETVSMPADRIWGSQKFVEMEFLGHKAHFPMGPFSVATMRARQVLAVNVMKTSAKSYKIYVAPLHYDYQAPRREQIRQLARSYADELERVVRLHPTQWYNYYDFWKPSPPLIPPVGGKATGRRACSGIDPNAQEASPTGGGLVGAPTEAYLRTIDIHELLPQQEPFVMVGSLTHFDRARTVTETTIGNGNMFVENGHMSPSGLIENIAQTCAARIGYVNKYILKKGIQIGFIGAIRNMEIKALPAVGETIQTTIDVVEEVFGMTLVHATVGCNTQTLATAEMKIAVKSPQAPLSSPLGGKSQPADSLSPQGESEGASFVN